MPQDHDITTLLSHLRQGDERAKARLMQLIYADLRRMARKLMSHERVDHTLDPTALVNEAYLRLLGEDDRDWNNRLHFFSVAAQVMRRILVDHARSRHAQKRQADLVKVSIDDAALQVRDRSEEILVLDQALDRLAKQDRRQGQIVELRFFGGLTEEEIGQLLRISPRTVKREWSFAKAWLKHALSSSGRGEPLSRR